MDISCTDYEHIHYKNPFSHIQRVEVDYPTAFKQ